MALQVQHSQILETIEDKMVEKLETDRISSVRELIRRNKPDLSISRVPPKTLKTFKQIAEEEFCGDYGMTLKWLVEYAMNDLKYVQIMERIMRLESSLIEKPKRKMLSGKVIKKRGDE